MKLNKLILVLSLLIITASLALAADFSLVCEGPVEEKVVCNLNYQSLDPNDFGGLDFTLNLMNLNLQGNPLTSYGSLVYNVNTKKGSLAYNYNGILNLGTLIAFNLERNDLNIQESSLELLELIYYDVNSVSSSLPVLSDNVNFASTQCIPTTSCATEERTCGVFTDNCGTESTCGTCAAGETCNAAGQCEATVESINGCTDSDGLDYTRKGTVSVGGVSYVDLCSSNGLFIYEYTCVNNTKKTTAKNCMTLYDATSRCVEGACVIASTDNNNGSDSSCAIPMLNPGEMGVLNAINLEESIQDKTIAMIAYFTNMNFNANKLFILTMNDDCLFLNTILEILRNDNFNNLQKASAIAYHLSTRG